jgi:queuosine precursor transporter
MNELIFVFHVFAIILSCIFALRLGKDALITLIVIQAILANLFITKEISLFHLCITCTDAFAVGSGLALNLLQEYYGKKATKNAILISFCTLIFYLIMSQFQLWYKPISSETHQPFSAILSLMPRVVCASIISYLICQLIDYNVYALLKTKLHNKFFILRNYGSLIISQTIDTILFSFLGLYGIVPHIWHIILVSFIIKIATIILATPLMSLLKGSIHKKLF